MSNIKHLSHGKLALMLAGALFFGAAPALAQDLIANYAAGKRSTRTYEHFTFYTKDGKVSQIYYNFGSGAMARELRLAYQGKATYQGKAGFKVLFPNQLVRYVIPAGKQIKVYDATGKYAKTFSWEYEGPVNGIGTFCAVCAQDETAAIELLKTMFMK